MSALAGMPVVVGDLSLFLDAARGRVEKSLADAVKRGEIDHAKRDEVLARIIFTPDLEDIASADIVIEAVPEILDLKVSLIRELDELVSPGTVIATNTSSIPIAELAGKVRHPGQVVGVHFFSPVPVMKLVEIIVALDTHPRRPTSCSHSPKSWASTPSGPRTGRGSSSTSCSSGTSWPPSGCSKKASPAGRT